MARVQSLTHQNHRSTVDGIVNVNKPKGWTSHDVVAYVRRLTRIRRVGHAGTLDPMATGVLLVCLGRATRITEYVMTGRKSYRAGIRLGISTNSHDAEGKITATCAVDVDRSQLERTLSRFLGSIEQIPPMVSAVKRGGQPLYKLARRGIVVERTPRKVEIYQLALTDWAPPVLTVELTCSPGTYVRALARDLGQELGCGAHLTALMRLASGDFTLSEALEMEQFAAAVTAGDERWHALVMPLDVGLKHFPVCTLEADESLRVRTGQPLMAESVSAPRDTLCRAYTASDKKLVALLRFDDDARLWRPHKVFHPL